MTETTQQSDLFAAIDLGSNSFHMIVVRVTDGHLTVIDRIREMVRLAAGLDEAKMLNRESMDRAIACLSRFGQRLSGIPAANVRVVGTNTLRSAHNSNEFLNVAEKALGYSIEIIAGREEARLIYLGVAHSLPADGKRQLVMDIGGGSTEYIIGEGFETVHRESLYMGCVSMSRAHFADNKITEVGMHRAGIQARRELQTIVERYRTSGWERAIGASGTIKAVDAVIHESGWSKEGITLDSLYTLRDELIKIGDIQQLQLPGLKPERAPVFPGGVAVLLASFEALGIEQMQASDGALREGLIYDLLGRNTQEDVRERTILSLCERYKIDLNQARKVETTAIEALSQVGEVWGIGSEVCSSLIHWAAYLHEIGLTIAHSQYHKHGAYLIENSDLPGFSRSDQRILSCLVRGHRRKFSLDMFAGLSDYEASRVKYLCIVLRIAVLLHRGRSMVLPDIEFKAKKESLSVRFPYHWLIEHPLTQADLEQEADYLNAADIKLIFE